MSGPALGVVNKGINQALSLDILQAAGETSTCPRQCGDASGERKVLWGTEEGSIPQAGGEGAGQ